MLNWLSNLLRSLFGVKRPEEDEDNPDDGSLDGEREDEGTELPESPLVYDDNPGAITLGIAVYQTTGLTERLGRIPEINVVRFLGQALTHEGYNYEITFGLDPLNLPDDAAGETLSAFSGPSRAGEHLNILLGDRTGGGLAYIGTGYRRDGDFWSGRYCLGPAGNIDEVVELVENAPANPTTERLWINLRASALHEPGHTLGGKHSDEMTDPDWQDYPQNGRSPSMLFNNVETGWIDSPPPSP